MQLLLFIAGLAFLILGAEALVRGSSRLAAGLGISPLVIGLTVVAFGTSAPELAVGIKAAVSGQADLALGNAVGSNIFNVLFILGLSALIAPLAVSRQLIRQDVPLMILLSALVLILGLDGTLSRIDGALLFVGLVVYLGVLMVQSRQSSRSATDDAGTKNMVSKGWMRNTGLALGGLALLVLGSQWLVQSAEAIARHLGVSEMVIGLTVVAAGTSLPELVTSVIASLRGERDIAVGNVVGSNLFNIMGVLGLSSIVAPTGIQVSTAAIRFDLPIMIAVAFACLPIFFTGGTISRREGAMLFGYYAVYTLYLFLAATHRDVPPLLNAALLYFVIPITAITLTILTMQARRRQSNIASSRNE
jgi:cation:H+ antiporter